ncbi:hypothetical protein DOK78_001568 [Enterococcus sp. DIV2402]|uniref:ABC-2 family transporter protein n=1 Tax=Candidatus Enterococcus lowellii TaxID=2230877 RepID=A0ABZ2SP62_9ENTE|nr:hypothetical protein [Enterococcus sp. DIV2402]MBO0464242.1 hypothetical protein [Enterococcus sp. DIV2402]
MLKKRLHQVLSEKIIYLSLLILWTISISQVVYNLMNEKLANPEEVPRSLSYAWILSGDSSGSFLFIMLVLLFPLSSLPFSLHLLKEKNNFFSYFYLIRSSKKTYLNSMLLTNSIISIFVTLSTLFLNIYLNSLFFPLIKPNEFTDYMRAYPLIPGQTFSQELFKNHPLINMLMYIGIALIYVLLINNLILLLGYFVNKQMYLFSLAVIFPFILLVIPIKHKLSPLVTLSVHAYNVSLISTSILFLCLFGIILSLYYYILRHTE